MRILLLNLYYPPDTSATAKMAATVAVALSAPPEGTGVRGGAAYEPRGPRPWGVWRVGNAAAVTGLRVGFTEYPRFPKKRPVRDYL